MAARSTTHRHTAQQDIVAQTLSALGNHPTADQVYEAVHVKHPSISRATVYRVLNRLAETGEASKVSVFEGADHFDHRPHKHYHVHCSICGKIDDVELAYLEGLEDQVSGNSGYVITHHALQFDGICPACQKARTSQQKTKSQQGSVGASRVGG